MNDLENLIRNNREFFDDKEPEYGHFSRFNKKLNSAKRKLTLFYIQVAAIIVAGIVLGGLSIYIVNLNQPKRVMSSLSEDMKETLYYYNSENLEMLDEFNSLEIKDKEEKRQILDDLSSYDENYKRVMKDLEKYPNDERVLNALIEVHRSRNEFLEFVLIQVKKGNQLNI